MNSKLLFSFSVLLLPDTIFLLISTSDAAKYEKLVIGGKLKL